MAWQIEFRDSALRELKKLDQSVQRNILKYIKDRLINSENPEQFGKPLLGEMSGYWRYRIQDYRIICVHDLAKHTIVVIRVAHRREVYD